jgi:hypothetical protein
MNERLPLRPEQPATPSAPPAASGIETRETAARIEAVVPLAQSELPVVEKHAKGCGSGSRLVSFSEKMMDDARKEPLVQLKGDEQPNEWKNAQPLDRIEVQTPRWNSFARGLNMLIGGKHGMKKLPEFPVPVFLHLNGRRIAAEPGMRIPVAMTVGEFAEGTEQWNGAGVTWSHLAGVGKVEPGETLRGYLTVEDRGGIHLTFSLIANTTVKPKEGPQHVLTLRRWFNRPDGD